MQLIMATQLRGVLTALGLLFGAHASAGTLVVIGGALESGNAPIFREVLGAALEGSICVLGTASSEPEASAAGAVADFRRHGGEAVAIAITVDNAARSTRNPKVVAQLETCGGYFFVGGDQSRITEALRLRGEDTPALTALRDRFGAGAVVAGTSAGAAMMSEVMITGGSSLDTLSGGKDAVTLSEGLGFADGVVFDQHFVERGRLARLVGALARSGLALGAGVGEDTALVVPEGGPWRVVGSGHVVVLGVPEETELAQLEGVEVSFIADGDTFSPETGRFVIAKTREDIEGVGYYYDAGAIFAVDVFGPGVLAAMAEELVDSPEREASGLAFGGEATASFTSDGVRLLLTKRADTVGYWGDVEVGEGYSVVRLDLSTSLITVTVAPAEVP